MSHYRIRIAAILALSTAAAPLLAHQQDPPEPGAEVEVLTRGPVHEAFAEPVVFDPKPGVVVPQAPPQAIEEMPPDQKPEGANVAWISGYWSWDDERRDFVWVSGIWRDIPPGRQWVPGYWSQVEGGYQWVSGYWAGADQGEANYLPEPPETLEAGPNTPAPSENHAWAPGYWYYRQDRYVWRPGYWFIVQPNWVWIPAHYVWTPGGYLFVDGYWDYVVAQRGLLFAPVYVPPVVIAQPAFVYTPTVVIQNTVLVDHFWCRPAYGHYYFGDYYAPAYQRSGFFFWLSFNSSRVGYDPIFVQQRFLQRQTNVAWESRVREVYHQRVVNVAARPPRTFAAQRALMASRSDASRDLRVAAPLAEIARARADMVTARSAAVAARNEVARARLEQLGETRRAEIARRAQALRQFQEQRRQRETQIAANLQGARESRAERLQDAREKAERIRDNRVQRLQETRPARTLELPRSPVAARPLPQELRSRRPEVPTPDGPGRERPALRERAERPAGQPKARPDAIRPRPGPRLDTPVPRPERPVIRRPGQSEAGEHVVPQPPRPIERARPDMRPDRPAIRAPGSAQPRRGPEPPRLERPKPAPSPTPRLEAPGPRREAPKAQPQPGPGTRPGPRAQPKAADRPPPREARGKPDQRRERPR
jgi:hypothetical protein